MGIVSALGVEDGGIALIAVEISSKATRAKLLISSARVWGLYVGGGGNRYALRTLAFSSKVVPLLIVAMLGSSFGKAFWTVYQRFLVVFRLLFYSNGQLWPF